MIRRPPRSTRTEKLFPYTTLFRSGTKRICQTCGTKFYDLTKSPIICPSCSAQFDPEALLKSRRPRNAPKPEPAAKPKKPKAAPAADEETEQAAADFEIDRKSTRLDSSH